MWRFVSILEDIDSTFILKEEQRNVIKAFVDRKDVFGSSKSLIYQLAPMVYVMVIHYVALIWIYLQPLSKEAFLFPGSVETRPHNHSPMEQYQTNILTRIMSRTQSG